MHLIGFGAYVRLCVLKPRDGAVAEAAHYCHQCVEVLQLQQLLWRRRSEGESGDIKGLYKRGGGHNKAAEVKKVHSVRWQKDAGVMKPWLGGTFGSAHMRLIWVHQENTERSNLSESNLSVHFLNGNPWASLVPFSPRGVSLRINGVAAVWEGWQGGIIWLSKDTLWNQMAKQCEGQRSIREVGSAKPNMYVDN